MEREELAQQYCEKGFNCAQAVLAACGDVTGLAEEQALAVAGGFGGGMRCGEVCGALSGAVMALGLAFPYNKPYDSMGKERTGNIAKEACARFKEEQGCLTCRELLEMVGDKSRCPEFITYCVQMVSDMIEELE